MDTAEKYHQDALYISSSSSFDRCPSLTSFVVLLLSLSLSLSPSFLSSILPPPQHHYSVLTSISAILERSLGSKNQRVAYTLNLIGELYAKQGKFGLDEYAAVFTLLITLYFPLSLSLSLCLSLPVCLFDCAFFVHSYNHFLFFLIPFRADSYFEKALKMNRELFGNEHPEVAENLYGLVVISSSIILHYSSFKQKIERRKKRES